MTVELFDRCDPTRTAPIVREFRKQLTSRFGRLERVVRDALVEKGLFGLTADSFAQGDPVTRFRDYLNAAGRQLVLGGSGAWTGLYTRPASEMGFLRAFRGHGGHADAGLPVSSAPDDLAALAQRMTDACCERLSHGYAALRPNMLIANDVCGEVRRHGRAANCLASYTVVKAFNDALLDELRRQGVTHVGVVPEHERHVHDAGPPDEPRDPHGRWATGTVSLKQRMAETQAAKADALAYLKSSIFAKGDLNIVLQKEDRMAVFGEDIETGKYRITKFEADEPSGHVVYGKDDRGLGEMAMELALLRRAGWSDTTGKLFGDAARKAPQPRHGKSGQFRAYKKGPTGYQQYRAREGKRKLERRFRGSEVDVETAGDERVCDECDGIAAGGPYSIDEAQSLIPAHPNCRCTFVRAERELGDYAPDQPRAPRGTSEGGQFTKAEGAAQASVEKGAAEARGRGVEHLKGSASTHPMTVSSRLVTAAHPAPGEDSHVDYLQAGYEAMRAEPVKFAKDISVIGNAKYYPQLRESDLRGKSPEDQAEAFIQMAASNIRKLYDETPDEMKLDSRVWYDGAHLIAAKDAEKYHYDDASMAAAYAALSPQTDWNENVYLGHQVVDIYSTKQHFAWTDKMTEASNRIWSSAKNRPLAALIEGKTLAQLGRMEDGDQLQAMWVRTYNQAYDEHRYFRLVNPDGSFGDWAKNVAGTARLPARWRTVVAIKNAIRALKSGGDRQKISLLLGDRHKVRSFYNNILDPHSENGDVTVDTHAVGAALLEPLGGTTVPVSHALGTTPPPSAKDPDFRGVYTSARGVSGLYGLYAEAYRRVARDVHLEPRQLQSITWDYKRQLLAGKQRLLGGRIHEEWTKYHNGRQTLETTQDNIIRMARETQARGEDDDE